MAQINLLAELEALGSELTTKEEELLAGFKKELFEWNKKFNLTRISEEDFEELHILDSLQLLRYILDTEPAKILDAGSGGGLPGIPLSFFAPAHSFLLVDSKDKKIGFLEHVISRLGLSNVSATHGRLEELAHQPEHREKYGFVIARALGELYFLAEMLLPFVEVGGELIALKGPEAESEVIEAINTIELCGGKIKQIGNYTLPSGAKRAIIRISKTAESKAHFPRRADRIKEQPL